MASPVEQLVELLLPQVRQVVDARAISWQRGRVAIVSSAHGQKAGVVGATTLILARLLSQPRTALLKKPLPGRNFSVNVERM